MGSRGYQHYVPKAEKNRKFPDQYDFVLLDTIEKLENALEESGEYIAWDLETTDLSPRTGKIVGIALGWDDEIGYYVPLRHMSGNIEDPKKALDLIYDVLVDAKKTFVYNMRFDFRFMEFENFDEFDIEEHIRGNLVGFMSHHGYDMSKVNWYDVMVAVWLADTNKKLPSLKWAARHFLGWDMQKFEEALGDNPNFQYVEPEVAVEYAGADALSTFVLAGATLKYYKESKMAGKIDNKVLYPIMKWEDHPLPIDYKYLESILLDAQEKKKELQREIHSMVGYSFNINSGQQLSEALEKLGLHTEEYTKAGYMRTAKDLIKKLDHPISDKLIEYKELSKVISSYISNMAEYAKKEDGKLRFAYKTAIVPTGRLACGGDKKNEYFAKLNLQCLAGDTTVFTEEGRKEIKDLDSNVDKVWDGLHFRDFIGPETKRKKVRKLILDNGSEIKSSSEHRILASKDGEVDFYNQGELNPGDYVAVNYKSIPIKGENISFKTEQDKDYTVGLKRDIYEFKGNDYRLWELLGYFVGDGFFKGERGIKYSFGQQDKETLKYFKDIARDVGIDLREGVNKKEGYDDVLELTGQKMAYYQFYKQLGMKRGARNKDVLDIVFKQKEEYRKAFVRGLFSSDGWVKDSVSYKTISEKLAHDIHLLMYSLGYVSSLTENKYGGELSYTVRVYDPVSFRDDIGFIQDYYTERLDNKESKWSGRKIAKIPESLYQKYKFLNKNLTAVRSDSGSTHYPRNIERYQDAFPREIYFNYRWIKVVENKDMETEEQVYDIYVPESERFVANGMIVHNSIPKSSSRMWYVHKADKKHSEHFDDKVIMGYRFSQEDKSDVVAEGFDPYLNIRRAFLPENEDFYWVSIDFSSQELRIPCNLSKEPVWLEAFNSEDGDPHKATAIKLFGEENYDRDKRKKAKGMNFGQKVG